MVSLGALFVLSLLVVVFARLRRRVGELAEGWSPRAEAPERNPEPDRRAL